jgi:hypothetical protein
VESKAGADTTTTVAGGTSGSKCDVNKDGTASVADVQQVIYEALGVTAAVNHLNGDGVVNAAPGLRCSPK